jgi:hypothetical protein
MSRFIDERGRIFGKVNVVDILVFLVIVAVIVFAVTRLTGSSSEKVPVTVQYMIEEVRDATVDAITSTVEQGGRVTDEAGTVLGDVVKIDVAPTVEEYMTPAGELEEFESPIYNDVLITVSGKATVTGRTARIGSVQLRVGKPVTLVGHRYEVKSTIFRVDF